MIDCISSAPKYRAHLAPVWAALPDDLFGEVIVRDEDERPREKGDVALVAGYMDYRAARRAGYKRIILLEHGIGQSYSGNDAHLPGGDDRGSVGLFLSPNAHAAARDAARYPKARVAVVGSTVLDTLPKRAAGPPVVAVTFHWSYGRVPEMLSAFDHFRDALADLAGAYQLIGHAHPQAVGMVQATYERLDIEYEPDYHAVFRRADVLIADSTSALYEFASTGRPVVVLNHPAYRRDVNHGLRFWDAADVGVQCDEPAALVDAVAEALADAPARQKARKAALGVVYGYKSGAGKRAAKAIVEWLRG